MARTPRMTTTIVSSTREKPGWRMEAAVRRGRNMARDRTTVPLCDASCGSSWDRNCREQRFRNGRTLAVKPLLGEDHRITSIARARLAPHQALTPASLPVETEALADHKPTWRAKTQIQVFDLPRIFTTASAIPLLSFCDMTQEDEGFGRLGLLRQLIEARNPCHE